MMKKVHGGVAYKNISKAINYTIEDKPVIRLSRFDGMLTNTNIGYGHCAERYTYVGGYYFPN